MPQWKRLLTNLNAWCDEGTVGNLFRQALSIDKTGKRELQDFEGGNPKRTMVRTQIDNAIALLMAVPEIATTIDLKTDKVAVFAYREKPDTVTNIFDKRIVEKMRSFGVKTDKVLGKPMFSDMGNGFLFTEVRYPEPYVW